MNGRRRIGIYLFDVVEELDVVGPWEVLSWWTRRHPEDGFEVVTFADRADPVTCAKGMRLLPDRTREALPALDVLLYPGGQGTRAHLNDEAQLSWGREQRAVVPLMTSVCTGALVSAAAGV